MESILLEAVRFMLNVTNGIRVSEAEEIEGVDLGDCGLEAHCLSVKT